MDDLKHSRRNFLRYAAGVAGAASFGMPALSYSRIIGANSRVRVGAVGVGDWSRQSLLPAFQQCAAELNFDLVALSDIWNLRRREGAAFLKQLTGHSVAEARNNDELYAMKDVDAVIIATADFQHSYHGAEAVRAGRHAYIETPLAQTMDDARAVLQAVEETGKIVQIGTRRRSGAPFLRAAESVRTGGFGDIVMAEVTHNVGQGDGWLRPDLVNSIRQEDTDWKRFLLDRSREEWDPRKYVEYRLFAPYSTGISGQGMLDQIDTLQWFSGYDHPRSVVASGGVYQAADGRTNPDTMTAILDYGPAYDPTKGFQAVCSSRMGNSARGSKELYHSGNGVLDLNRIAGGTTPTAGAGDDMTVSHMRNWMESIRGGCRANADIRAGFNHSVAICMVTAALESGRRVRYDAAKQEIVAG